MECRGWLAAASIAVGTSFLGGCVVAPAEPYYADEPVVVAPPPPRVEMIGVAPAPGYVWIEGYWGWSGSRHQWVPGRWAAPRPGYRWEPHRWAPEGRGWREHRGRWSRY